VRVVLRTKLLDEFLILFCGFPNFH
jgi:hypothetical protein